MRYPNLAIRALDEIAFLAFANVLELLVEEDAPIVAPEHLPRPILAAPKKLEADEVYAAPGQNGERTAIGRKVRLELHDKIQPLRLLSQHYGLLVEKIELTPPRPGFAEILEASAQRVIVAKRRELLEGTAETVVDAVPSPRPAIARTAR